MSGMDAFARFSNGLAHEFYSFLLLFIRHVLVATYMVYTTFDFFFITAFSGNGKCCCYKGDVREDND